MFSYFTPVFLQAAADAPSLISGASGVTVMVILVIAALGLAFFGLSKIGKNETMDTVRHEMSTALDRQQLNQTVKEQAKEIEELKDRQTASDHWNHGHAQQLTFSPKN